MNRATRVFYTILLLICIFLSIANGYKVYEIFTKGFNSLHLFNIFLFSTFTYDSFVIIEVLKGNRKNKINININN